MYTWFITMSPISAAFPVDFDTIFYFDSCVCWWNDVNMCFVGGGWTSRKCVIFDRFPSCSHFAKWLCIFFNIISIIIMNLWTPLRLKGNSYQNNKNQSVLIFWLFYFYYNKNHHQSELKKLNTKKSVKWFYSKKTQVSFAISKIP